jgi:hypothetical protein
LSKLASSVTRAGILPYNYLFISDHRACFVNFDQTKLFQDTTPSIAPIQSRKLEIEDPRIVSKYIEALDKQIAYHKLDEKINITHQEAITGNLPTAWSKSYENIDKLLTESMLHAKSISAKVYSGKFQW